MKMGRTGNAPLEITRRFSRPNSPDFFTLAAARLKVLCSMTWKSVVGRARGQSKMLSVRETAALGDRRFVSVIQFERQRFLIGSSPSSVTLLAQLPDRPSIGEETREESEKTTGEAN
jgi:flagellar biogenesis protein FliO